MSEIKTNNTVPDDKNERREWVKYQLKIKGLSFSKLASEHEASRQVVSATLVRPNPRWEQVIAKALGMTPDTLFPERYDQATKLPVRVQHQGKRA